ncbi:MAG: CDP-alcohol phosphatidyltransferase family protein [Phycisphaerae bacterium]
MDRAPGGLGWPNRISLARILLVAPFLLCLWHAPNATSGFRHAAVALVALLAASDFLDGYLARRLNQVSDLGRLLDPAGDKLLITAAFILLTLRGVPDASGGLLRVPAWVFAVALGKDLLVVFGCLACHRMVGQVSPQPSRLGKLCTALQLGTILLLLLAADLPPGWGGVVPAAWWLATIVAIVAAADYVRIGLRLVGAASDAARKGYS